MAIDDLDITSNDWRIVRENLVQLHCEDVSWEQASDKIPLDLVRYLLGDLVQNLSTLAFLRGNRCLFTINWTHIPDSISVWENLLSDFFDRKVHKQVGHYRFTYMLSHVGPKYDDLVNIFAILIGVVHILALGERIFGKCNLWGILRCYIYLQICQGLLQGNLKWLRNLMKVIFLV